MKNSIAQISVPSILFNHFYVGVIMTTFYVWISPLIIDAGFPGISVLLMAEVLILAPIVLGHLALSAKKSASTFSEIIPFQERLSSRSFLKWFFIGLAGCFIVYVPLYPVGQLIKANWFAWLPEWYFNPSYGTDNVQLIANTFLLGILIDGFVGPVAEEFFFRGYLLPRMSFLKGWAPVVNGALFGMYHFWQPHNVLGTMAVGIVLSFVAWKTKNVYVSMAVHCAINVLGALAGYLAASNGVLIGR